MGLTVTTSDGTTTYARAISSNNSSETTTITDAQSNQTVVSFVPVTDSRLPANQDPHAPTNWIEVQRQNYQGSASGGTLLQTVFMCYNGNKTNCSTTAVNFPITEVSRFVQLGGGKENEQDTFLDKATGNVMEIDEYDFGASAPGPLLRKTVTTYASLGNNISNLSASVTVCSPGGTDTACNGVGTTGGTRIAQTTFGYDEGTLTPASNVSQHVSVSGSRGNMTSIHRWLNTTGTTLDTLNTFDDTGNVLSTTDPGGHTTSFSSFGCNGAFPTQTTLPDTSSPNLTHHKTAAAYDCDTGLVTSVTDQNNQVTTFSYDNMLRLTEVDYADTGKTTTSYPDPNHVTVQRQIDSSRSTSSTTVLDGYGRVSRTAVANGESTPYDQQDFCYDANGRVSFRSYPYQSDAPNAAATCPSTLAGDSFGYDVLGRSKTVTHSDGTSASVSYAGLASRITDEGNGSFNVSRILQKDGLGRLSGVCELYNGAPLQGSGGTPAACNLDIAGTGFLTTYGYDTLGNLTSVTQGAQGRAYAYDSVSRMTSETTPEAGTVTYTYNADSLLATTTRPAANQASASVTWTTTDAYDALHRLTGKTYTSSDPTNNPVNTPAPLFNYDESSVWSTALSNTIGRLSSESVGGSLPAEQIFSYDPMGRPLLNAQCMPNNCSATPFSPHSLGYQYDFLGDVTSAGNSVGVTFTNSYNIAGRLTGMTSSLSDATHPATLLSNMSYSPIQVTGTLGNGVVETTKFSPRGFLTSYLGDAPGGQPGTGSVTISGSLQTYQQQTQPGTNASITVFVNGQDGTNTVSVRSCGQIYQGRCLYWNTNTSHPADRGSIQYSTNANGTVISSSAVGYNGSSTTSNLAQSLAGSLPSNSYVTAAGNGNNSFTVTASTIGTGGNSYSISIATYSYCVSGTTTTGSGVYQVTTTTTCGSQGWSFSTNTGSGTFAGGTDPQYQTAYDNGSTTITVNNNPDAYPWSGSGTTASSIAQGLCQAINGDTGAFATASTNGIQGQCPLGSTTISLASKQNGQNYPLTASSSSVVNSFSVSCPGFSNCSSASLTGAGNPAYSYTLGLAPDGQVTSANDLVNGSWTFAYDPFNRLASSNKNSGQQTFTYDYDRYGNRWHQNAPQGGPAPQYVFDTNNHFVGSGVGYDAAGNVVSDGLGNSFVWDAEGRLAQVNQGSTVIATYSYDAEGRRVHGPNGEYVYALDGNMITQLGLNGAWGFGEIYAGGRHLATYSGSTTNFYHGDWLGTKRVMTATNGTTSLTCTGFAFGDGVSCAGTNWTYNGFTDDIHDPETNLEHTLFRKYSGTQGRWLTSDPAGMGSADPANPQSWNRYAYVTNNPVTSVDPRGLDGYGFGGGGFCDWGTCLPDTGWNQIGFGLPPFLPFLGITLPSLTNFNRLLEDDSIGPTQTLADRIQELLAGLPWNNPCAQQPWISDGCGLMGVAPAPTAVPYMPDANGNCLRKNDPLCLTAMKPAGDLTSDCVKEYGTTPDGKISPNVKVFEVFDAACKNIYDQACKDQTTLITKLDGKYVDPSDPRKGRYWVYPRELVNSAVVGYTVCMRIPIVTSPVKY
jgi:RHS repeat-associated protein